MPKIKTKHTIEATINIGRGRAATQVTFTVPVDLATLGDMSAVEKAVAAEWSRLNESASPKISNRKDLQASLRAVAKHVAAQ